MASKTVKQYRVLVDELDSLVRDWFNGVHEGGSIENHVRAIKVVADHIRSSTCSKLPAAERESSESLVARADAVCVRFYANKNVEYCFVIDHPRLGQIGGYVDDNWCIDRDSIEKCATFVRSDWSTRIIARDVATKIPIELRAHE